MRRSATMSPAGLCRVPWWVPVKVPSSTATSPAGVHVLDLDVHVGEGLEPAGIELGAGRLSLAVHPAWCAEDSIVGKHAGNPSMSWALAAAFDPELGVGAGQMTLDRLEGHVQLAGDFTIGAAFGCQPGDAQLAGSQRLHPGAPRASAALSSSRARPASGRAPRRAARSSV